MIGKYWKFLVWPGVFVLALLIFLDRRSDSAADRLLKAKPVPQSSLDADPDLKLITERTSLMRSER